ncbi:hypothetical protein ASE07_27080 [Noviherbaspirillum sp. Root189]|nr:hypothetical protein ASE07_27080 [Noviherbaspirillum sp. Root189]
MHPDTFTDSQLKANFAGPDPVVLQTITNHLLGLGTRCLQGSQTLDVEIHDIDLAGQLEWWHGAGGRDLRVMREMTWPRMDVSYVLRGEKGHSSEAREKINDMNYLSNSYAARNATIATIPLPYERAMLTRWFETHFCQPGKSRGG